MEGLKSYSTLAAITAAMLLIACSVISVQAQISSPCTVSMVTSFTPCVNYITGSSAGGSSQPTAGCCDSVKSLMSGSMDCACLIVTGNVPISLPINRTLAISLPRACSLPLQCKASGVPLPAPGPVLFAPPPLPIVPASSPLSPVAAAAPAPSPFSPKASQSSSLAVAETPVETPAKIPASPPVHSAAPTATPGSKPVVTSTSASSPSYIPSPSVLLVFVGIMVFKGY